MDRAEVVALWQAAVAARSATILADRTLLRRIARDCPACPAAPLICQVCRVGESQVVVTPASPLAELCDYWLER